MAQCFVGIDVAKAELVVAIAPQGDVFTVANRLAELETLATRLRNLKPARVVLEPRVAMRPWRRRRSRRQSCR